MIARREYQREAGFTLIEVIVAIVITGIIVVVLGFSITESLSNTTRSRHGVDRSVVRNFASRYFGADVASSSATVAPSTDDTSPPCGSGQPVIDITLGNGAVVSYQYVSPTPSAPSFSLYRRVCTGSTQTAQTHIGTTSESFTAGATCIGATCTLSLTWTNPAETFSVTGVRRVTAG